MSELNFVEAPCVHAVRRKSQRTSSRPDGVLRVKDLAWMWLADLREPRKDGKKKGERLETRLVLPLQE